MNTGLQTSQSELLVHVALFTVYMSVLIAIHISSIWLRRLEYNVEPRRVQTLRLVSRKRLSPKPSLTTTAEDQTYGKQYYSCQADYEVKFGFALRLS